MNSLRQPRARELLDPAPIRARRQFVRRQRGEVSRQVVAAGAGDRLRQHGFRERSVHDDGVERARLGARTFEIGQREVGGERRGDQRFEPGGGAWAVQPVGSERQALRSPLHHGADELARERQALEGSRVRVEAGEREARAAPIGQVDGKWLVIAELTARPAQAFRDHVGKRQRAQRRAAGRREHYHVCITVEILLRQPGGTRFDLGRAERRKFIVHHSGFGCRCSCINSLDLLN